MQSNFENFKNKIAREMEFIKIDPENMSLEQDRIYKRNLAIINCSNNHNSLYKVLSLHF